MSTALQTVASDGDDISLESHIGRIVDLSRGLLRDVVTTSERITEINRATRILSMNARVEAARAGAVGAGFGVVAEELTRLSADISGATKAIVAQSRESGTQLDRTIADLFLHVRDSRYADLAYANIDLVDRNLYERSCDVRWWATDAAVCDAARERGGDAATQASRRLGQILDSYTVYADLVVTDLEGRILANGRPSQYRSTGMRVSDATWFRSAMATRDGTQFGFESVHVSPLVGGKRVLAYSCVVREGGRVDGRPLGVLGILFDWDALGQTVVQRTPLSRAEWTSTRACLVDAQGILLADTAGKVLQRLEFPGRTQLFATARGSTSAVIDGQDVRIAHAASPGFETYRTGWHSLLIFSEAH